jgi:hypothetical protein
MYNINKTSRNSIQPRGRLGLTAMVLSTSLALLAVNARADYKYKAYNSHVGDDYYAAMDTSCGIAALNSSASGGTAYVGLDASCKLKLVGNSFSVAGVRATASSINGTKYGNYSVKLAGMTVKTDTTSVTKQYSILYPVTLFDGNLNFVVGSAHGKAAINLGVDCTFKLDGPEAAILGTAYVEPVTTASANVGYGWFSVNLLDATLKFGKTSLVSSVVAAPTKLSGKVDLAFQAVDLHLSSLGYTWIDWHSRAYTYPLIQLF